MTRLKGFDRLQAVYESHLPGIPRAVLLAIAFHVNDKTGEAYPSLPRIHELTGFSLRAVRQAVGLLRGAGILVVLEPARQHKATRYAVDYDTLAAWQPQTGTTRMSGESVRPAPRARLEKSRPAPRVARPAPRASEQGEQGDSRASDPIGSSALAVVPEQSGPSRVEQDAIRRALEARFSERTALPVPDPKTDREKRAAGVRWWQPLRELAELVEWRQADALQLLDAAISRMQGSRLTVSAPASVLEVARSIVAEVKRGVFRPEGMPRGIADLRLAFRAQEVDHGSEVD